MKKTIFCALLAITCSLACCLRLHAQGDVDTTWVGDLPVCELSYDAASFNPDSFAPAHLVFHSAEGVQSYDCRVRHRGGTSLLYDKPNFALKLVDADTGESLDASFLGMRKDNNWILDAMASDHGKVRNRASMDLWLDSSRPPYQQPDEPKAVNGYHGHDVEVYANGSYMGLYCLSERVDRKQLKLKKYKEDDEERGTYYRGLMYKAVNGAETRTPYFLWQKNVPDDERSSYDGVNCEYPDVSDGEPWSWTPLRDNIYWLAAKGYSTFNKGIAGYYDLPVFMDYVLVVDLLCAYDNIGKNFYCWFYDFSSDDRRLGITPWDLDATWGRDCLGGRVSADHEMSNKSNFHTRMSLHYTGYADTLAVRYAALRDSLWTETALCSYFDRYFDLFERTGVWQRELDCWRGTNCKLTDLATERSYIHTWIHNRLLYLDEVYGYAASAAIRTVEADASSAEPQYVDLWGRRVDKDALRPGQLLIPVDR